MRLAEGNEILRAMLKAVTSVEGKEFKCHCGCQSSLMVAGEKDVIWIVSCVPSTGMFALVGVTSFVEATNLLKGIRLRQAMTGQFNAPTEKMWKQLNEYVMAEAQRIDPQPTQLPSHE